MHGLQQMCESYLPPTGVKRAATLKMCSQRKKCIHLRKAAANLRIRLIRTGLRSSRLLCFPPLVLVHQLGQVGSLFRMADDQFMLQQFFGSWPLWKEEKWDERPMPTGKVCNDKPQTQQGYIQNWALCWGRPPQTPWEVCCRCPPVWAGCSLGWGITPSWDGAPSGAARLSPAR